MRIVTLALLPILASCATPRESCLASVGQDQRVLNQLIIETRGNLHRGFAIETEQKFREVRTICKSELPDGTEIRTACKETQVRDVKVPVAIDLNAERAKLQSLEERQRQMQVNSEAARQQCLALHPE